MDDIFTNDELLSVMDSYCDKLIEVERLEEFKKHNLEFKGDAEKLEEGKFVVKSIQEHLKSELPVKDASQLFEIVGMIQARIAILISEGQNYYKDYTDKMLRTQMDQMNNKYDDEHRQVSDACTESRKNAEDSMRKAQIYCSFTSHINQIIKSKTMTEEKTSRMEM